jgi:hypothetical protein
MVAADHQDMHIMQAIDAINVRRQVRCKLSHFGSADWATSPAIADYNVIFAV